MKIKLMIEEYSNLPVDMEKTRRGSGAVAGSWNVVGSKTATSSTTHFFFLSLSPILMGFLVSQGGKGKFHRKGKKGNWYKKGIKTQNSHLKK